MNEIAGMVLACMGTLTPVDVHLEIGLAMSTCLNVMWHQQNVALITLNSNAFVLT